MYICIPANPTNVLVLRFTNNTNKTIKNITLIMIRVILKIQLFQL